MVEKSFTHLSEKGVRMVDVGDKPILNRTATAKGSIYLKRLTIELIKENKVKKGDVLITAQIAAINAVKNTHHLIPLCHSLKITGIDVEFKINENKIETKIFVKSTGKTGVEMEALVGTSTALLTIWDMVKSIEKDDLGQYPHTKISDIIVSKKEKY
jgi:cyclic pyranopterin monophosphate synthase